MRELAPWMTARGWENGGGVGWGGLMQEEVHLGFGSRREFLGSRAAWLRPETVGGSSKLAF